MIGILIVTFSILNVTLGASIGSIAQNVHSDVVYLNANLASALPNRPKQPQGFDLGRNSIPIGKRICHIMCPTFTS